MMYWLGLERLFVYYGSYGQHGALVLLRVGFHLNIWGMDAIALFS